MPIATSPNFRPIWSPCDTPQSLPAAQVLARKVPAEATYPGEPAAAAGQNGPTHSLIPCERKEAIVSFSSRHAMPRSWSARKGSMWCSGVAQYPPIQVKTNYIK